MSGVTPLEQGMEPGNEDDDTSDQRFPSLISTRRRVLEGGGTVLGLAALSGQGIAWTSNNYPTTTMDQASTIQGSAQLRTTRQVSLKMAKKILDAAEKESRQIDLASVITVTDAEGNLIAQRRMDNAWLPSVSISRQKAYTAAGFEMPTHNLADITTPGESLWGLHTTDDGQLVIFGGGYPLEDEEEVVGAIGSSGGTVAQDRQVAEAGVDRFNQLVQGED